MSGVVTPLDVPLLGALTSLLGSNDGNNPISVLFVGRLTNEWSDCVLVLLLGIGRGRAAGEVQPRKVILKFIRVGTSSGFNFDVT